MVMMHLPNNGILGEDFRGFHPNGIEGLQFSQGGAEPIAAVNTNFTFPVDEIFWLQYLFNNNGASNHEMTGVFRIGAALFDIVSPTSTGLKIVESPFITHQGNTHEHPGGLHEGDPEPWGTIDNKCILTADSIGGAYDIPDSTKMVVLYSLMFDSSEISPGTVIEFRPRNENVSFFRGYNNIPFITVGAPLAAPRMLDIRGSTLDIQGGTLAI